MKLTENGIRVLQALASYYVLTASMVHRAVFPQRKDRRNTRRLLQHLVTDHYVARSAVNVAFSTGNSGPAYYLTAKGADALAVYYGDEAWLQTNVRPPRIDRLYHWLDIAEAHWIVETAVNRAAGVTLNGWLNEWQTINDEQGEPTSYVLHTQFREGPKPLSCSPDAAFCLEVAGHRRVHYVEVDRGTTGAKRVAASKVPGYAELLDTQGHRRHFPGTTFDDFAVLIITTSPNRRDILRSCVAGHDDLHPEQWLFVALEEFTPQNALFGKVIHDYRGGVGPLLEKPAAEIAVDQPHTSQPVTAK
ncbi:MAG: replication-relaxation family protein [Planctomycetaceae bacterium]|nr:replication-relaxation family protein [Planctomycetaceae bacterium]